MSSWEPQLGSAGVLKCGWGPWKERKEIRTLRKSPHKIILKSTQWAKQETIMTFNSLSHIVLRVFLSLLDMHKKSTRERRNFQCVLQNRLLLTGHLLDPGCLQKTERTLSHQSLLQSLPRSPKEERDKNSGWVYFFPRKSFHFKNLFLI